MRHFRANRGRCLHWNAETLVSLLRNSNVSLVERGGYAGEEAAVCVTSVTKEAEKQTQKSFAAKQSVAAAGHEN